MIDPILALLGTAMLSHLLLTEPLGRMALGNALMLLIAAPLAWGLENLTRAAGFPGQFLLAGATSVLLASHLLSHFLLRNQPTSAPRLPLALFCSGLISLLIAHQQPSLGAALWLAALGAPALWLSQYALADLQTLLQHPAIPSALRGTPVLLISTGLGALALLGLNNMGTP